MFCSSSEGVSNTGVLEIFTMANEGGDFVGMLIGELGGGTLAMTEWPLRNLTDFFEETLLALPGVGVIGD